MPDPDALPVVNDEMVEAACSSLWSEPLASRQHGAMRAALEAALAVVAGGTATGDTTLRLYGYICPECATWAEDMTPHCFNEHDDDPVATLPFYVSASLLADGQ